MKKILGAFIVLAIILIFNVNNSTSGGPYWSDWPEGTAKGLMPPCKTNVLALGGDDVLQDTVDTYCAVEPGQYISYINPNIMDAYKARAREYPNGRVGILAFPDIQVAFTTNIVAGKPVYDVLSMKDGTSVASSEPGHPLNPAVCASCHLQYQKLDVCRGFVCGNRM